MPHGFYHLHHGHIGRRTHAPGSASGYARYITRAEACTVVFGQRAPTEGKELRDWLDSQEKGDRRNARVIDTVEVGLPREFTREQNIELLENFCERMTQGRASWVVAIHDGEREDGNPHAHIIFRDRDVETSRRVMLTTEKGSTERFREGWEQELNIAYQRNGYDLYVDRRSYEEQGVDREPQIHVGQAAEKIREKQLEFQSAEKQVTRLVHGAPTEITINYPVIDGGQTRFDENEARKQRNAERELWAEGPQRPDFDYHRHATMEGIVHSTIRLDALYQRAATTGQLPPDDADPVNISVRDHIAERSPFDVHWERSYEQWCPFEFGFGPGSRDMDDPKPSAWRPARRGPYPDGPGNNSPEREDAGEDYDRDPGPTSVDDRPSRKDATDLGIGAGLAIFEKLSQSVESLLDGPSGQEVERQEEQMAKESKVVQITEDKQRREEQEAVKERQREVQLMLEQRARERGMERGR